MKKILNKATEAHNLFLIIVLLFGAVFAISIPPLWGTDETAHFARSYQIAHGELSPPKSSNGAYGGSLPNNLITLWNYTKSDLLDNSGSDVLYRKDVDSTSTYKKLTHVRFSQQKGLSPGGAIYSPFAYPAPVFGIWVANIFHASIGATITMARLSSLFLYALVVWTGLRLLAASKLRWLLFSVALLPTSVYQASVVTADNMVIGLSLLLFAIFIRIVQTRSAKPQKDIKLFGCMVGVAALLALIKVNYVFLGLLIFLVPREVLGTSKQLTANIIKTASLFLVAFLGLLWSLIANATASASVSQRPDGQQVIPKDQVSFLAHHPLSFVAVCFRTTLENGDYYLRSLFGLIGWNYVYVPLIAVFVLVLGLFIASIYARDELARMRTKLAWIGLFVLGGIASTYGALYITFTPTRERVVEGLQGRYFIPFLAPILMIVGGWLPMEVRMKDKTVPYIFGAISIFCLMISTVYYVRLTY